MEALRIENLSFRYPSREDFALKDVSLTVERGAFVLLTGASGSGKTTLLRHLKTALSPAGERSGQILLNGRRLEELSRREQCARLGFVFQNPDEQLVTDKVWHEMAFALESLGLDNGEMRLRIAETAAFFGIGGWFRRDVSTLSGGQKQLLNLASVMAAQPEALILDEPTGQLDPIAAGEFLQLVRRINLELGVTVILSGHRVEEAAEMCDRLVLMDKGRVIANGKPPELGKILKAENSGILLLMPAPMRVWASVPDKRDCPVSIREGRAWLETLKENGGLSPLAPREPEAKKGEAAVVLKEVWFRYGRDAQDVLRGLSASVRRGEIFALSGGNGAGKSTALGLMAGTLAPCRGKISLTGRTALLPQDPRLLFLRSALEDDLREAAGKPPDEERLREAISLCGLEDLLKSHPYDLSGGQLQLAATAKLLLLDPDILLLDEPAKGLDALSKNRLCALYKKLAAAGRTIVIVSHDTEFSAACADTCAMLFDGEIVETAPPRAFFAGKSFYTTAAARMARGIIDGAVLPEDIIAACGGTLPDRDEKAPPPSAGKNTPSSFSPPRKGPEKSVKKRKRTGRKPSLKATVSALVFLLLIPLTIVFGLEHFGERRFYFVSLLVIIEAMAPFFLVFEGRRPKTRELVIIAALCALAVAGRVAFYMLMQFKPTLAIIILAGACFGGETGFLTGAVTALVSNFFFGQGPWTAWQMFAMGAVGFFAGALFHGLKLPKTKTALCIYGFAACLLYGGIMNPASVLLTQAEPAPGAFLAAFALGLPMDLVQCAATVVFLLLISGPMIEKLDRIKLKFGIALS